MVYRFTNDKISSLDRSIVHSKNSLGFRGPDAPANFTEHLTIIIVGGSTSECCYLSDGKAWPHHLGNRLSQSFDRLWVNNAGLDGNSTFGHTVLMRDYITDLKPKVVVFLVGINDVGRAGPHRTDSRILKHSCEGGIKGVLKMGANYSEIMSVCLNIIRARQANDRGIDHRNIDLKTRPSQEQTTEQIDDALAEHAPAFLAGYQQRLENLIRIAQDSNIEPVLVTQPSLLGTGIDPKTGINLATLETFEKRSGALDWALLEKYNGITRQVAIDADVPLIDLAKKLPKSSEFFYDFYHFNDAGAEVVAEIIASDLAVVLVDKFPAFQRETKRVARALAREVAP
jgi:lysophospholipase L1-like esterase